MSAKLDSSETKRAVRSALSRWTDVVCANGKRTSLRFQELADTQIDKPFVTPATEGRPGANTEPFGIYFRDRGWDNQSKVTQIAVTHLFTKKDSPLVVNADMVINASDWVFALDEDADEAAKYKATGDTRVDLESVVTHEVGHYIGLAHSAEAFSIMADGYCGAAGRCLPDKQVRARRLGADDQLGVCELYPPGGAVEADPSADSGCSVAPCADGHLGAASGAGLAVLLASAWLRRRRR